MPTFCYDAIDDKGQDVSSVIVAENKEAAIQTIRATGKFVFQIRETTIPTEILSLIERQEQFEQIQARGRKRLYYSKILLSFAAINCITCITCNTFKIPWIPAATIPLSFVIILWSIWSINQMKKDRKEFDELLQKGRM